MEIDALRVTRTRSVRTIPGSDPNSLAISLWFGGDAKMPAPQSYFVRLLELGPVSDDTGRGLATDRRRAALKPLHQEVRQNAYRGPGGRPGTYVDVLLDAPARPATRLVSLRGRAELAEARTEVLKFDDLGRLLDKPLAHPALKGLTVRPTLKSDDARSTVILVVQGEFDRLLSWDVTKDGRALPAAGQMRRAVSGGVELEKSYNVKPLTGVGVTITAVTTSDKKVVEFQFENLELP